MDGPFFFSDRLGDRRGPFTPQELADLARAGEIPANALVWSQGGEPTPAHRHPALAAIFAPVAGGVAGPLKADFPIWGLCWRFIVFLFGVALIIPAPWAGLWFYRWLAGQVGLPGGQRLSLTSTLGACWFIFAGIGLFQSFGVAGNGSEAAYWVDLAAALINVALGFALLRWFCRSLRSQSGDLNIAFEGDFWAYLGWTLLVGLSFVTIFLWAWVVKFQLRWLCRNVRGTHEFEFIGSGLEILWRTLVFGLGAMLLVTFPWALAWYARWLVSQIIVRPSVATAA